MKKALILVLAALMIPSVALAAKPSHSSTTSTPMVTYKLKGTLSTFAAYNSATRTNGSITIVVRHANHQNKALKGTTLFFPVDAHTKIKLKRGLRTIKTGDRGWIKVRVPKNIAPAYLPTQIQTFPASKIVDKGAPKAHR